MDIFLYDNTNNEYIKFPIIPKEVEIISPQQIETFDSLGKGQLKIIGLLGNRTLNLNSFFPVKDYIFSKDRKLKGMQYVDKIQEWRITKKSLTVIISDLNINFKCVINNFTYNIKDGSGDIYYNLDIEEYKVPEIKKISTDIKLTTSTDYKGKPQSSINYLENAYGIVTAKSGLNVRSGNGINYDIIGILKYGEKVKLYRLEANGEWWHIYYKPHGGHCKSEYIRRI